MKGAAAPERAAQQGHQLGQRVSAPPPAELLPSWPTADLRMLLHQRLVVFRRFTEDRDRLLGRLVHRREGPRSC